MERSKEKALPNFISMIKRSWTYERMTEDEKKRLYECFESVQLEKALKGSYHQRWGILHVLYSAFLAGLGYDSVNGWKWREPEKDKGKYPSF